jgi:hypothetical protein
MGAWRAIVHGNRQTLRMELGLLLLVVLALLLSGCGRQQAEPTPTPFPPTPTPIPELAPSTAADLSNPRIEVIASGLFGPIGLAELPNGGLLIAEEGTGGNDDSAGISLLTPDGRMGRLISGLPSTLDAGDLAGVPLVRLSPDGSRIYLAHFGRGHLWTLPLSPEQQQDLTLPEQPYDMDDLVPAMMPLNNVFLINPFAMVFEEDGTPVVTDASANGVAIQNPDGTTRFFHRFPPLPDPLSETATVEAVPTGIERWDGEFLVTLTGGCPYPEGAGQLVQIDQSRNQQSRITGLNMPIDVAHGPDGTLWLLEFAAFTPGASCFDGSGYLPGTGRLSRILPGWELDPILTDLDFPGALLPARDGSLYISQVLTGEVLRVTFE